MVCFFVYYNFTTCIHHLQSCRAFVFNKSQVRNLFGEKMENILLRIFRVKMEKMKLCTFGRKKENDAFHIWRKDEKMKPSTFGQKAGKINPCTVGRKIEDKGLHIGGKIEENKAIEKSKVKRKFYDN